ncbi:MAG: GNAT family N-acetyltransferase [Lacisediminihabitans sp.]
MSDKPAWSEKSITLRRADEKDATATAEVLITSRAAALGAIRAPVQSDEDTKHWVETGLLPYCDVWIAEADGQQTLALLVLDDDWIDQLYVRPEAAGLGIGSRLVELAKQHRPGGLQTRTSITNPGAIRFYERHGFVLAPLEPARDNLEKQPSLRYVWSGSAA